MLKAYPSKFELKDADELPNDKLLTSVLGESRYNPEQYNQCEQQLFCQLP